MDRSNGLAFGAADSQPGAQPAPIGGDYQLPLAYAPRPPGTYAGGPGPYSTAGPGRRKIAALSVISMICGIAGLVLGTGAQIPLMLVIVEVDAWPRSVLEALSVAGTVGDGATLLLGVVGVVAGVVALVQIGRSRGRKGGAWMAITGMTAGGVVLSLAAFFLLLALAMGGS